MSGFAVDAADCPSFALTNAQPQPTNGGRLYLLLQGPVGPFFARLKRSIENAGCNAIRINFNGGDWLYGHGPRALNFSGPVEQWREWLTTFLQRTRPAAMILFGDSRPYHVTAIEIAAEARIPVWCLEEGYVRPQFITCERGGNNARSPLRSSGEDGERHPANLFAPPASGTAGNSFAAMSLHAVVYYVAMAIGSLFFPDSTHHRNRGLIAESLFWVKNALRKIAFHHRDAGVVRHLIQRLDRRYFVVALQVHDDQQFLAHGSGWTMDQLVTEAIQSFAKNADATHHLVIKVHPLDRGHRSYRRLACETARRCGCSGRVLVVENGSIGLMIRHSLGLITVNSTSGLIALARGVSVLALGRALYTIDGLAMDGTKDTSLLDCFWRQRAEPHPRTIAAFFRRMHRDSLIRGSFYLRSSMDLTADRVFARVREGDPPALVRRHVAGNLASPIPQTLCKAG